MVHSSSDALVFFRYRTSDSPVYDDAPQTWGSSEADMLASTAGGTTR